MSMIRKATATLTAAAAGDYSAGDVWSGSATNNAGTALSIPVIANDFLIIGIFAVCSEDSVLNRLRLHWFSSEPTSSEVEMDDNAAFGITTSTKSIGWTDLSAFEDHGGVAEAQNFTVRRPILLADGATSLPVVVETLDAETNETAGMTVRFDVYYLPAPI